MKKWRKNLNKRVGEAVFLAAQKDYVTGDIRRKTSLTWFTYVLAGLVLATPFCMLAAGIALAYVSFLNVFALIIAVVLMGVGWQLIPRRGRVPKDALRRDDLPRTFELVDRVGAVLGAPPVTAIAITEDYNASIMQAGKDRVLRIGAILWAGLDEEQKLALIAHEMAHLVNGDPTRYGFFGAAVDTLAGWHETFSPVRLVDTNFNPVFDDSSNTIGDIIAGTLRALVEVVWSLLERLVFLPQQRAEYLADALSAEVAGPDAPVSLLQQCEFADQIGLEVARMRGVNLPNGQDLIQRLARATTDVTEEDRAERLSRLMNSNHAVDATHPPSGFRIAFLQSLPTMPAKLVARDLDVSRVDVELGPHFGIIGDRIAASLARQ